MLLVYLFVRFVLVGCLESYLKTRFVGADLNLFGVFVAWILSFVPHRVEDVGGFRR